MNTPAGDNPAKIIPAVQNLNSFQGLRLYRRDQLEFFQRIAGEYGDIGLFRLGPFRLVMLNSPRLIYSLMVEHAADFDKGKVQIELFKPVLGQGLFTSEGTMHQRQRKLLAPAFQPRRLSIYAATMVDFTRRTAEGWAEGATLDLNAEMMSLIMRIVGKVLLNADVTDSSSLSQAIDTVQHWIKNRSTSLLNLPLGLPTPANRRTQQAMALIRQRVHSFIREHRSGQRDQGDLLSMLLQARDETGQGMSDGQVFDEALIFFLAGHETTAQALAWTFYLLGQHPAIYARLLEENRQVLGSRLPAYDDLARLPFTLQVLKESLRLYPPSSAILRAARRHTELDGYPIRQNDQVMFSQYVLHRRPDIFPDPLRFDPERFRPDQEESLPRFGYLPFGAGHRICIGNHFALMEGHLILSTLAQLVELELLTPLVEPELVVTLRPRPHLQFRVHPRRAAR